MERILKIISNLGSELAVKLVEPRDQKKLDRIMKKLLTYASVFPCLLNCESLTQYPRSLEEEDKKIKAMLERGFLVRLARNGDDVGELVSSGHTIKDALDTFLVSCSWSV
jgi:hypothetical protein